MFIHHGERFFFPGKSNAAIVIEDKGKNEESKLKRPADEVKPKIKAEEDKTRVRKNSRFESVAEETKDKDKKKNELDMFAEADNFGEQYDVSYKIGQRIF